MNIEPDIFDYLETTSLEPHDDYTSEITYKDQKIIWNKLKEKDKEIERLHSIIKEVREKINNFDVFKEFTFPLMKRDEEQQVKSSIDYEWKKSIEKPILEILDKENNNEN